MEVGDFCSEGGVAIHFDGDIYDWGEGLPISECIFLSFGQCRTRIGVGGGPKRPGIHHASIAHGGMDFGVECGVVIADEVGRGKVAICLWDAVMDLGASASFIDKPHWSWVDSWHGEFWVWGGTWQCGNGCKVSARGSGDQSKVGVVTLMDVFTDTSICGWWECGKWRFAGWSMPKDRDDLSQRSIEVYLPLGNHGSMVSSSNEFLQHTAVGRGNWQG
jgi:hypothetical protein